jgi:diacylglycerol kinase family enzyme
MTVCLVPRISRVKLLALFPFLLGFGLKTLRSFHVHPASRVRVESSRPLAIHGDGEVIGRTPVTFEVLPKALKVFISE